MTDNGGKSTGSGDMPNYMNEVKALSDLINKKDDKGGQKREKNYGDSKKEYLDEDCENF